MIVAMAVYSAASSGCGGFSLPLRAWEAPAGRPAGTDHAGAPEAGAGRAGSAYVGPGGGGGEAAAEWLGEIRGTDSFVPSGVLPRIIGFLFGEGRALSLVRPLDVAVADGRIAISDPGLGGVLLVDLSGGDWRILDGPPSGPRLTPTGLAFRPDGELLVCDTEHGRVLRYDRGGRYLGSFGEDALQRPTDVNVAPEGHVVVADAGAHAVVAFGPELREIGRHGGRGNGPGQFNFPLSLSVCDEALWVTDALNARVQVLEQGRWRVVGTRGDLPGTFGHPKGVLALCGQGEVVVTDAAFDVVQRLGRDGTPRGHFGRTGIEAGRFNLPEGMARDEEGRLYVADALNGRVQVFALVPTEVTP